MISAKQTEELLKHISSRLSGRDDCKKLNYKVVISEQGIHMEPIVYVYPNRYKRKETDKIDIISFIHNQMSNVKLDELVFGRYEYQLSIDGKNRRWRKTGET